MGTQKQVKTLGYKNVSRLTQSVKETDSLKIFHRSEEKPNHGINVSFIATFSQFQNHNQS